MKMENANAGARELILAELHRANIALDRVRMLTKMLEERNAVGTDEVETMGNLWISVVKTSDRVRSWNL